MKVIVKKEQKGTILFPKLMENEDGAIVLFRSNVEGILLQQSDSYSQKIGESINFFDKSEFHDFKGSITLENEIVEPIDTTEYKVVLLKNGDYKLQVVKAIKERCGLGLKEAKDLCDLVGDDKKVVIKDHLSEKDAIYLCKYLMDIEGGVLAQIELQTY
jgi:ribosomal protein L7/L12